MSVTQRSVFKIRLDDDLRRRSVHLPFLFEDLVRLVRESYPALGDFSADYVDDEGDHVTVTNDAELAEVFHVFAKLGKTPVLFVRAKSAARDARPRNAPAQHWGVVCDATGQNPIVGARYHKVGANYDLCQEAFDKLDAAEKKAFERIDVPHRPRCGKRFFRWRAARNAWAHKMCAAGKRKNWAKFVSDASVADATVFPVGTTFDKKWCVVGRWGEGCYLELVGGDPLGAKPKNAIPANDAGNEQVLEVSMKAPSAPGRYKSFWRLTTADGKRFGQRIWADVVVTKEEPLGDFVAQMVGAVSAVGDAVTKAVDDAEEKGDLDALDDVGLDGKARKMAVAHFKKFVATFLGKLDIKGEGEVDEKAADGGVVDEKAADGDEVDEKEDEFDAVFLDDLTIPDGAEVAPGSSFTKKWRLKGRWTSGVHLVHVGGANLGPTTKVSVERNAGGEVTVSLDGLCAPLDSGRHKSFWRLVREDGQGFGHKLWIDIAVTDGTVASVPDEVEQKETGASSVPVPDEASDISNEDGGVDERKEQMQIMSTEGVEEKHQNAPSLLDVEAMASEDQEENLPDLADLPLPPRPPSQGTLEEKVFLLVGMGFADGSQCRKALIENDLNVRRAIEQLITM